MPTITLFTPFSGRIGCLAKYFSFLENQKWPKEDIFLFFLDTSQETCGKFKARLHEWLRSCDYPYKLIVEKKYHNIDNLADLPRHLYRSAVNETLSAIYNDLTQWVATDYSWVVEDDTIPPPDACAELMKGFDDEETFSVTAAYRLNPRYNNSLYVVWKDIRNSNMLPKGSGIERVQANGFGCVLLKNSYFKKTHFSYGGIGYDMEYYERQLGVAKINWDVECEHISNELKII